MKQFEQAKLEVAIKYDIVKKSGAWFDIIDTETGEVLEGKIHGQGNVHAFLSNDAPNILHRIEELIEKEMKY